MRAFQNASLRPKRIGNYKPGPGRPKGSKNKKTLELEAAVRAASAAIGRDVAGAFEGDAHAFLMAVYRDPAVPIELRILAASRALRVEKPVLTIASVSGSLDVRHDLAERLEAARRRAGLGEGPTALCSPERPEVRTIELRPSDTDLAESWGRG